jgi:general secretion pathway protein D
MKPNHACLLLAASLLPLSPLWLRAADPVPATPPTQTAHSEVVTRQQLAVNANQAISDGQRFLSSGNYDDAAKRFQFALDNLAPAGVSAHSYSRAEVGLAAAKAGQAQQFAKDDKFGQAHDLLTQAIVLQPNNPVYPADIEELKKQQLAYEEEVRDPEGTTVNPAVTDDFKSRVATVQKLLFQGDAYFRTGQFDKSEETYSKILILDPYNKAARDKMAHIERYKERADGFRHEEYEQEQMENVDHHWSEEISPDIVLAPKQEGPIVGNSTRAAITRKLQSIVIDKVNFEKLDVAAVIQFLQQKSKELDSDHQGINFVLRLTSNAPPPTVGATPGGAAAPTGATDATAAAADTSASHQIHREVSITLENVPLSEVLGYVISQTNLQYSVEDYAVYLRPSVDEGETLTVRTYLVPPNFFEGSTLRVGISASTSDTPSSVESVSINAQKSLTDKGIRFPAGASAIFLPGSSKLVVRNTPEQLDLVANLIDQLSKETPQVEIEAKIAEFNQDAIKALSFNYFIGTGTGPSVNFGASTALRNANDIGVTGASATSGVGGLSPDDINELIQQNSSTSGAIYPLTGAPVANNAGNVLSVGGVLDNTGFLAVINAINNLQGVSLLSAPSVTTQSGLKANIDIVREFPYPTSFEKPKLSNSSNIAYSAGPDFNLPVVLAIPPTPREFVTQDVGVSLEVKPTTYPDQRIDLNITKAQVLDFDGFIDYGVPIRARLREDAAGDGDPQGEGIELTAGTINQPVFNLRSVVTNLQILDGQTAVLGGLLREDTQEINDKVPILGDLPLIGRAFQSKVSERTKKSLLIFVTARLIRSNGKPEYVKTFNAEPDEQPLPEPDQQIGPGNNLPPLPEEAPNS